MRDDDQKSNDSMEVIFSIEEIDDLLDNIESEGFKGGDFVESEKSKEQEELEDFLKLIIVEHVRPFGAGAEAAVESCVERCAEAIYEELNKYTVEHYVETELKGASFRDQVPGKKLTARNYLNHYWGDAIDSGLPLEYIWDVDKPLKSAIMSWAASVKARKGVAEPLADFHRAATSDVGSYREALIEALRVDREANVKLRRISDRIAYAVKDNE